MRLIVQVPCYDEAETLPRTIAGIPRQIAGVDRVEILVIDDGSRDDTAAVARRSGADHVVRHRHNQGLARAFRTGLEVALQLGADVIVNTDGDDQYPGTEIPALIAPILDGRADIVVGDRQVDRLAHVSGTRKLLQAIGGLLVRELSGTRVPDTVSGFRAFSKQAALRLNIVSEFSYTVETLVQAGAQRMAVVSIPVATHPPTRPPRLYRSLPYFLLQSASTLVRTFIMYRPLRVFGALGALLGLVGALPVARFLLFYLRGQGGGHVQSLVLGGVLLVFGFVALLIGLVADLISCNRRLLEQILEGVRRLEVGAAGPRTPSAS